MQNLWRHYTSNLNTYMLASIVSGCLLGYILPNTSTSFAPVGELFIRALTLLIVPVIVVSMLSGILNLSGSANLGRLGSKAFLYYFCTTALAVLIGLSCVNIIQPGLHPDSPALTLPPHDSSLLSEENQIAAIGPFDILRNIIPQNVVRAAHDGNVLGLIFFSIFLGIALLKIEHPGKELIRSALAALFEAIIWMVDCLMLVAPLGILSLVSQLVAGFVQSNTLSQLGSSIGWYSLTVITGLLIHGLLALPLLAIIFKVSPFQLGKCMLPALTTAFSTASSAATLPVTIDSLEKRAGISNRIASFIAPLGATVNMDGTAIYEAIAAVFIANMYGVELSFTQQLIIFLTATFSAIGAAGIPGAGLIMMTLVLDSVGLPAAGIQLIVVVDRGLDMLRTCINVWGDSLGAAIIARSENENILNNYS